MRHHCEMQHPRFPVTEERATACDWESRKLGASDEGGGGAFWGAKRKSPWTDEGVRAKRERCGTLSLPASPK